MNDNKPQVKDDQKSWSHGDMEDLCDPRGGTDGEITTTVTPGAQVIQPRGPHQNAQSGADVRSESLVISDELPEGLKHERKGPMNKTTGRRPAQD